MSKQNRNKKQTQKNQITNETTVTHMNRGGGKQCIKNWEICTWSE